MERKNIDHTMYEVLLLMCACSSFYLKIHQSILFNLKESYKKYVHCVTINCTVKSFYSTGFIFCQSDLLLQKWIPHETFIIFLQCFSQIHIVQELMKYWVTKSNSLQNSFLAFSKTNKISHEKKVFHSK